LMRDLREIDDDADVRMPERAHELSRSWRRLVAAKPQDVWQRFQRPVIAFRIDDAEAIALQDQLFADQSRKPGLPGPRLAGDQDRSTADGQLHRFAVGLVSEQQAPAAHLRRR